LPCATSLSGKTRDEIVITITGESYFLRGDSNGDGIVDISDAVNILSFLFLGSGRMLCKDAADVNDDGILDISDAITTLGFLFLGNPLKIFEPDSIRGLDPTPDSLDCTSYGK